MAGEVKFPETTVSGSKEFQRILDEAIRLPSLEAALAHVAIWDTERIVKRVRENPSGTWESCWEFLFRETIRRWNLEYHVSDIKEYFGP